jgi:hypothetical protein
MRTTEGPGYRDERHVDRGERAVQWTGALAIPPLGEREEAMRPQ